MIVCFTHTHAPDPGGRPRRCCHGATLERESRSSVRRHIRWRGSGGVEGAGSSERSQLRRESWVTQAPNRCGHQILWKCSARQIDTSYCKDVTSGSAQTSSNPIHRETEGVAVPRPYPESSEPQLLQRSNTITSDL